MAESRFGIDFGNDQRHLGIHPPVTAFVDDHAVALHGPGTEFLGDRIGRAADGEIDVVERFRSQQFDLVLFTFERNRRARGSLRGQKCDFRVREIPFFQHLANQVSHSAGGTDNGDRLKHVCSPGELYVGRTVPCPPSGRPVPLGTTSGAGKFAIIDRWRVAYNGGRYSAPGAGNAKGLIALETSNPQNVSDHQKLGFVVADELKLNGQFPVGLLCYQEATPLTPLTFRWGSNHRGPPARARL